jgi:hypothetical protein
VHLFIISPLSFRAENNPDQQHFVECVTTVGHMGSRETMAETLSLDSSCVLLQWLCTTGRDCVSLDSSCVLLQVVVYHYQ